MRPWLNKTRRVLRMPGQPYVVEAESEEDDFDPLTLPDESAAWAVYYDAADATDTGGVVSALTDSSGNAKHAVVTGGQEPTYDGSNADFNDHTSIHFPNAGTKRLGIPTLGLGAGPYTIVAVCKWDGAAGYLCTTNDANDAALIRKTTGNVVAADQELPTFGAVTKACPAGACIVIFVANGDTSKLYVSAHTATDGDGGSASDLTGNTHMLGNYANSVNGAFALDGDIAIFGILDDAINQTDAEYLLDGFGEVFNITIGA
jgi:hypothetical protein